MQVRHASVGAAAVVARRPQMKIDITYNSIVKASNFSGGATEEAAFKSAVDYVVKEYESLFTNPDTINITVGWGTPSHPGDLGHSSSSIENFSYSAIKTALGNTAAASCDAAQAAVLPRAVLIAL
jgi:hypothetical protein